MLYVQSDFECKDTLKINVPAEMREKLVKWAISEIGQEKVDKVRPSIDLKGTLADAGFEYTCSGSTVEVTRDSVVASLMDLVGPDLREVLAKAMQGRHRPRRAEPAMSGQNYYLLTALPALGELGSEPPITPQAMLEMLEPAPRARAMVEAIFLSDDLQLRQAVLAGEVEPEKAEPIVLSAGAGPRRGPPAARHWPARTRPTTARPATPNSAPTASTNDTSPTPQRPHAAARCSPSGSATRWACGTPWPSPAPRRWASTPSGISSRPSSDTPKMTTPPC